MTKAPIMKTGWTQRVRSNRRQAPAALALKVVLAGLLAAVLVSQFAAHRAAAAELRLRAQCNPAGPVVTLGDVAEIESADARQTAALAAIELFPAPSGGEQRLIQFREIQDLLLLRGVNLTEHRFSGSSEVTVEPPIARSHTPTGRPISAGEIQRIKRRIGEALVKYLSEHATTPQTAGPTDVPGLAQPGRMAVEFDLNDDQARVLADPVRAISVAGGSAPWVGVQSFDLSIEGPKGAAHVALEAKVRSIAPVVVVLRPLARGAVIREGDVQLKPLAAAEKLPGVLHAIEEAIGHELVRPLSTDSPVLTECLRAPLSVHRGEVVTVYAQSGAIRIRTNARARDEGSVGELVAVESLLNRTTYYARVSGIREVEVFARPAQVAGQPAENQP
jgi:flagella basal body P-ring formation protein FlgA